MENSLAKNRELTYKLVGTALLTAIVVVLQIVGGAIKVGTFSISLVLMPIVVGAALFGIWSGAWLGLVFGVMVMATGDAALFLAVNVPGTIITVLAKGILAGLAAGAVLIGCAVFFMDTIKSRAGDAPVFKYMIVGLVGFNFILELAINLVLNPVIVRIVDIGKKSFSGKAK